MNKYTNQVYQFTHCFYQNYFNLLSGKYTLLHNGHLLVHHTSTYDSYKKYTCKTEHTLTGRRRRSRMAARLTLTGKKMQQIF